MSWFGVRSKYSLEGPDLIKSCVSVAPWCFRPGLVKNSLHRASNWSYSRYEISVCGRYVCHKIIHVCTLGWFLCVKLLG